MKMSYLFIMTFWFCLTVSNRLYKKHVYNSVLPSPLEQVYNISSWVRQLHLQQCVLVEIGEKYCAVFVEYRSFKFQMNSEIQEYFLGLCDTNTLRKWKFCPSALEKERPTECAFHENTEFSSNPSRVHRRLCEVTDLAVSAHSCDCSGLLAGQKLHKVGGFPTCFMRPIPESLCRPRNVCGVATCNTTTLGRQIHSVRCNPKCLGGQPFCESTGPETIRPSEINSYWSDWNEVSCDGESIGCAENVLFSEAICINRITGMGAIDCLGPGTNCCPTNVDHCKCYVYTEDGIRKLLRQVKLEKYGYDNFGRIPYEDEITYKHYRSNNRVKSKRHFQKYKKIEEEYEDDGEDGEYAHEDDIILEEEHENDRDTTTREDEEKDEIKQNQIMSKSITEKYPVKDMAIDTAQQQEESRATGCTTFFLLHNLNLLVQLILLIMR